MVDPWIIILAILAFVGAVGTYHYRNKYKRSREQYEWLINPKPSPRVKSQKELDREAYEIIRSNILLRDHFRCQECGYYKHLEVHHIIPRSKGGTDEEDNLITLCTRCHSKKHGFKRRESKRDRHRRRNRRKRQKRYLNKHRNQFIIEPTLEDEPREHVPQDASPERRRMLYEKWQRDELNQKK